MVMFVMFAVLFPPMVVFFPAVMVVSPMVSVATEIGRFHLYRQGGGDCSRREGWREGEEEIKGQADNHELILGKSAQLGHSPNTESLIDKSSIGINF